MNTSKRVAAFPMDHRL